MTKKKKVYVYVREIETETETEIERAHVEYFLRGSSTQSLLDMGFCSMVNWVKGESSWSTDSRVLLPGM